MENIFQLLSKIHPNDSCAVCAPVHGQRHNLIIHLEDNKSDIGWGSQIRSYVLDDARIKDLRTGVENRNTQAVLDGDLDRFIEASLKAGL